MLLAGDLERCPFIPPHLPPSETIGKGLGRWLGGGGRGRVVALVK